MWIGRALSIRLIARIILSLIVTCSATSQLAVAQQVSLSGWFHVIWGDPRPGSNLDALQAFTIIDDQGQWTSGVGRGDD